MSQPSDALGRTLKKLRISLTEDCNFSCSYCKSSTQEHSVETPNYLSPDEIYKICNNLIPYGLQEIRLTGGEPLLRKDILSIIERLSTLQIRKLALTTNGYLLEKYLVDLGKTACDHINISLDSLNEKTYQKITGSTQLPIVLRSILKAKELGFKIRLNTVMLKGINDLELGDFLHFAKKHDIEIRFLELMKIGVAEQLYENHFLSNNEVITELSKTESLTFVESESDSTSIRYQLAGGGLIGFISSESRPFCANCTRIRLSADGHLRPCLLSKELINVRHLKSEDYEEMLTQLLNLKPTTRGANSHNSMQKIGG